MIINGDGGYALLAAYIGGPAAPTDWLVQRSAATWHHFCIHTVNRVNSRNSSAMMTYSTINIVVVIIIIIMTQLTELLFVV